MSVHRREFLGTLGAGLLGLGALGRRGTASPRGPAGQAESLSVKSFRPLGTTGLKVSDVSCGAIMLSSPDVLMYARDCGVNYFDTAEGYLNGKSETFLGQAFGGSRDKVIITTKYVLEEPSGRSRAAIIRRVEASLKRLRSDYIDIALIHGISDPKTLSDPEVLGAFAQLKKEGRIRFAGFSTHNAPLLLAQDIDPGLFQVALVIYNHLEGKAIEPLIDRNRKKGVGMIAMKVLAGGQHGSLKGLINDRLSYPQAAIRWVLANPSVDGCIVSMASFNHVEEYLAASGQPLERSDLAVISRYQSEASPLYCRVSCRQCLSACPENVAINDVLRYAMYCENYGMQREAMRYYAGLETGRRPVRCQDCSGPCVEACPYGLKVRERLLHSHEILMA